MSSFCARTYCSFTAVKLLDHGIQARKSPLCSLYSSESFTDSIVELLKAALGASPVR